MSEYNRPHPIWLLAPETSIVEAALLTVNVEPQGVSTFLENWEENQYPEGYVAAREAITSAISRKEIEGRIEPVYVRDNMGSVVDSFGTDYQSSRVALRSLREWLRDEGYVETCLKLPVARTEGFRDPDHPRYSPKLAAFVAAWEEFDEAIAKSGTAKQKLEIWLRKNAARFDLLDEEGKPRETLIGRLAQVANWAPTGGAPKKSLEEPEPYSLDSDIRDLPPF